MGETVAILSGKGGTGKTSVCAAVAIALAADGNRVLCIDCDVGLRNLDISLGLSDCGGLSFLEVCQGGYPLTQATVHPRFENLSFLTAPMNCLAEDIDPAAFRAMVRQASQIFDYILLDAPAGVDAGFRLTALCADRCVLVTGPSPAALRDAARVGELLELMGKTSVRLVVNRISKKMFRSMDLTVDDMMDTAGLPLLGIVPEDFRVTLAAAAGHPLIQTTRRGAAAAAGRIAKRIQGIPVPISTR